MERITAKLQPHEFSSRFLEQHRPVVLARDAMAWFAPIAGQWHDYRWLKAKVGDDAAVDVACCASKGGNTSRSAALFSGDENFRQDVQLQFASLCDLASAAEEGTRHFAMDLGLEYYLCQCPVLSKDSDFPASLPGLAAELELPPFLKLGKQLHSVNLWLGVAATLSFCGFHNAELIGTRKGGRDARGRDRGRKVDM